MKSIYSICMVGRTAPGVIDDSAYNNIKTALEILLEESHFDFNFYNLSFESQILFRITVEIKVYTEINEILTKAIACISNYVRFRVANVHIKYIGETEN